MWLSDSLPKDLPAARVIIYGYDSSLGNTLSFQNLEDLGNSFRTHLQMAQDQVNVNQT